jgi:hypothetical protein
VILEISRLGEINLMKQNWSGFWPGFEIDVKCCTIARVIRLFFGACENG